MYQQVRPLAIDPQDLELDKIPGFWVVTYWPNRALTLRLKIVHLQWQEPEEMIAEVRRAPSREFTPVSKSFMVSAWGLLHLDEDPDELDAFPRCFRREFVTMACHWASLSYLMECGGTKGERYEFEPGSSVDCYAMLPEAPRTVL